MAKEERVSKNSEPTEQSVYRGSATVGPTPTAATRVCKDPPGGFAGENASMKRTLVAQNRRIQQLMAKVDTVEKEREAMRQQVRFSYLYLQCYLPPWVQVVTSTDQHRIP